MKFSILISEAAYEDIKEAFKWYEKHRTGLSLDFELCLEGDMKILEIILSLFKSNKKTLE